MIMINWSCAIMETVLDNQRKARFGTRVGAHAADKRVILLLFSSLFFLQSIVCL